MFKDEKSDEISSSNHSNDFIKSQRKNERKIKHININSRGALYRDNSSSQITSESLPKASKVYSSVFKSSKHIDQEENNQKWLNLSSTTPRIRNNDSNIHSESYPKFQTFTMPKKNVLKVDHPATSFKEMDKISNYARNSRNNWNVKKTQPWFEYYNKKSKIKHKNNDISISTNKTRRNKLRKVLKSEYLLYTAKKMNNKNLPCNSFTDKSK